MFLNLANLYAAGTIKPSPTAYRAGNSNGFPVINSSLSEPKLHEF